MFIGYAGIFLFALGQIGVKADIKVFLEEIDIVMLDPEYFDVEETDFTIVENSNGENTITAHVVVLKETPSDGEGRFNLLGLAMGKYNLPTGFDINMGFCEMLQEPVLLGPFLSVLGFKAEECPPKPGTYHQEGFALPMDNLPDSFIDNKYVARLEIIVDGKVIASVNTYLEVQ